MAQRSAQAAAIVRHHHRRHRAGRLGSAADYISVSAAHDTATYHAAAARRGVRSRAALPAGLHRRRAFIFGYPESTYGQSRPDVHPPATGLRLAVTPSSAQVFVDSYYAGTVDDVTRNACRARGGPAPAGAAPRSTRRHRRHPHHRARDHDLSRRTRRPAPSAAAPPVAGPSIPTVMYVIPNCYMGNLPPRQSRLPSGCDVKQVQVIKPTVASR
jgi:hypothetical protein